MSHGFRTTLFCVWLTAIAISGSPGLAAEGEEREAAADGLWPAIGQVNIGGYRRRAECTGALIGPRLVLTAAHCLYDQTNGLPYPAHLVHFLPGVRRDARLADAVAACFHTPPAWRPGARDAIGSDIAVIVLSASLAIEPLGLVEEDAGGMAKTFTRKTFTHVGYPARRRYLPSVHKGCTLRKRSERLLLTDCDAAHGSSGGPVMVESNGSYKIAGVLAALTGDGLTLVVRTQALREMGEVGLCP